MSLNSLSMFLVNGVTPCQLVCQSYERNVLVIRELVVADGTPCKISNSPNAICIQGICTVRYSYHLVASYKLC